MGNPRYQNGFRVTVHPDQLWLPLRWRQPRRVFVNSMSDLFHEEVPEEFIRQVFAVMRRAHWHNFQVLTKRAARLEAIGPRLPWPSNVWMGVSIENQQHLGRIRQLRSVPAAVRFLSIEPLLGPITSLPLHGIGWVILGGESGPKSRPMRPEWARAIRDACLRAHVPFFFKQWGEWAPDCMHDGPPCRTTERPSPGSRGVMFHCGKARAGHMLDGVEIQQIPNF